MKTLQRLLLASAVLTACGQWGMALAQDNAPPSVSESVNVEAQSVAANSKNVADYRVSQLRYSLLELNDQQPLLIHGREPTLMIDFGSRLDQVIESAQLNLMYRVSPSLLDGVSQLRLRLNGEVVAVKGLSAAQSNGLQRWQISLPAPLFSLYNQLEFELLSEVNSDLCRSQSESAWISIERGSELSLTRERLMLANELAYFPEPLIDLNDFARVKLPIIIASDADQQTLTATAIMTSMLAATADWRGMDISLRRLSDGGLLTQADEVRPSWPQQHALLVATAAQLPPQLDLPNIEGPMLIARDNPDYPAYKVLIVTAPDTAQLVTAAQLLSQQPLGFNGDSVALAGDVASAADAYQAPRWLSTERPVRFAELVERPELLQVSGYQPEPVTLNLRLPPDLFTWQHQGIPVDVEYRYSQPLGDEGRLLFSVNNLFVRSFTLNQTGEQEKLDRVRVPLLERGLVDDSNVQIPAFKLGLVNQLQFQFSYAQPGDCKVLPTNNNRAAIDANSQVDISGYDHYVAMPNLNLYAKAGYPFSRWHDLSQTTVVLSQTPSDNEVLVLLNNMAMIAAATGAATTHVSIQTVDQLSDDLDNDILIIGQRSLHAWLQRFGEETLKQQLAGHAIADQQQLLLGGDASQSSVNRVSNSAIIVGFRSPLQAQRSVVAISATDDAALVRINDVLSHAEQANQVKGFATLVGAANLQTINSPAPYYVGQLDWWTKLSYHLSRYPIVIALLTVLALIVAALILRQIFSSIATRRQRND